MSATKLGVFEIDEPLGRGGMAQVWRGSHFARQVPVAIKVITAANADDPEFREAFRREVEAVAALDHPGIVSVYDYGDVPAAVAQAHPSLRAGTPYLVMELAALGTLEDRGVVSSFEQLRDLLLGILDALAYAHARGLVHRDLKPANLLLVEGADGEVRIKLTDFGIAHAVDPQRDIAQMGALGTSAGTPQYMPPEQLTGRWRDFGPWTDLYALGCLAWRLCSGRTPFQSDNLMRLAMQHLEHEVPELEPSFAVPEAFVGWLRRLLAKNPYARFERAADAAWALAGIEPAPGHTAPSGAARGADGDDGDDGADATALVDGLAERLARQDRRSPMATLVVGDTIIAQRPIDGAMAPEAANAAAVASPPPMPADWRVPPLAEHADRLGVGLGLFGLRTVPFVDREAERDAYWQALSEAAGAGDVRAVVLRGASGRGKSRLAEWMARRAEELGAASVLKATHSPLGGPGDGLGRMLELYLTAWRMDARSRHDHIERRLAAIAPGLDETRRLMEAHALGAIMGGEADPNAQVQFASPQERYAAVVSLLRHMAARRLPIVWLDDIQWGADALGLAEYLLDIPSRFRCLVVLTAREEALQQMPEVATRLEALDARAAVTTCRLGPLAPDDHREFIDRMLPLAPSVAAEVASRTDGNPMFALQLVGDWVQRDLLEPSAKGFVLRAPEETSPQDLSALWRRRIFGVVDAMPATEQQAVQRAIEIAAALGQDVDAAEWRETCAGVGIGLRDGWLDGLVAHGLARRQPQGWSFIHGMLAETVADLARDHGRWASHHRACAEALTRLYPVVTLEVARRLGEHWLAAAEPAQALAPLLHGVELANRVGDQREASRLIDLREVALDRIGAGAGDRRRLENLRLRAANRLNRGDARAGRADLDRLIDLARRHGLQRELAAGLRLRGDTLGQDGRLDEALELFEQAQGLFERIGDDQGVADCLSSRAWCYKTKARFDEALDALEEARAIGARGGDATAEASMLNQLAFTWLAAGDYERTRDVCRQGLQVSRRSGARSAEAGFWTTLGEVERYETNWDKARACYAEARRLDELCGGKHQYLVRLNSMLNEIGAGGYDAARQELVALGELLPQIGFGWLMSSIHLGWLGWAAGVGDWTSWDAHATVGLALVAEQKLIERDVAWLCETAGRRAVADGQAGRARPVLACALDQWQTMGETALAAGVAALLRAIEEG